MPAIVCGLHKMTSEFEDNPFAAGFIRPGQLTFIWPAGESLAALVERLRRHHGWGEIIGPHGSGKSTLLAELETALRHSGREVKRFTIPADSPVCPREVGGVWSAATQVIVDGWEQLSAWSRWRVRRLCRRRRAGLLITAHRSFGFPPLITLAPTHECARAVVAELQARRGSCLITAADVAECFARHQGNMREMLFALYDLFEARR